jgi:hypothetical protein
MNEPIVSFGLESIDFQSDSFFPDLTTWVGTLRKLLKDNKPKSQVIQDHAIALSKMIKNRFNMTIEVKFITRFFYNACIYYPQLSKNTGIVYQQHRPYVNSAEFYKQFDVIMQKGTLGWMDKKKAKVYGLYADLPSKMEIGIPLVKDSELSDGVIAGIVLHEIGHAWDMFAGVGVMYSYTRGMSEIQNVFTGLTEPEDRKVVIDYLNKSGYVNIKRDNYDRIVSLDAEKAATVIITDHILELRSQSGISGYENKTSEQGADTFAARFGAAKDLAVGLDFIHASHHSKLNKKTHYLIQFIKLGLIIGLPTLIGVFLVEMFIDYTEGHKEVYDDPKNRLDKLKQQILIQLKDVTIEDDLRKSLLTDLDQIQLLINTYSDNSTFTKVVVQLLSSKNRSRLRQNEVLFHLERMSNNKLFASASRLKEIV